MTDDNFTPETIRQYITPECKVISVETHHTILSNSPYQQETDTGGLENIYD